MNKKEYLVTFNVTPSASQLRELLPDVAAHMEQKLIIRQLRELKIEHTTKHRKGELIIEISLTHNFYMRIRATDVGPGNQKEFFTIINTPRIRYPDGRIIESEMKETIRVHIEIFDGIILNNFSHTFHENNLKDAIKAALEGFYQSRNIALKPLPRITRKAKSKKSPPKLGDE